VRSVAYDDMLTGVNEKLAKTVAHFAAIDGYAKSISEIVNGKLKQGLGNLSGVGGGGDTVGGSGGGGNIMSTSLGHVPDSSGNRINASTSGAPMGNGNANFTGGDPESSGSPSPSGRQNPNFGRGSQNVVVGLGLGSFNSAGTSGDGVSGSGGGGDTNYNNPKGSLQKAAENAPPIASNAAKAALAVASAAWTSTPGLQDAIANQQNLFPVSFAMQGGYAGGGSDLDVNRRITDAVNNGSSGIFDPVAAAAGMTNAGFTMNMGRTADRNLTTAGFMYQMTGMSNMASVQGSMAMTQGKTGISNKLMSIGISTVGSNGDPKDIGRIVDQLWDRWYPGGKKVTEEQFDRDLAMGFLGSNLRELFGDETPLYAQAVQMLRLKAKEGGRKGITAGLRGGENSAIAVAQKHGLTQYSSPMAMMGDLNTAQGNLLAKSTAGMMAQAVNTTNTEVTATQGLTIATNDATVSLKALAQAVDAMPIQGSLANLLVLAAAAANPLLQGGAPPMAPNLGTRPNNNATGGHIDGPGTSTSDSIPVNLSKGEFVINARAANKIGKKTLGALNATGHTFGSGYASPAQMLASGGEVVQYARQFVGKVDYIDSDTLPGGQGSASPKNGWDCSTFTKYVYRKFGKDLVPYSDSQTSAGTDVLQRNQNGSVDSSNWEPGDLIVYANMGGDKNRDTGGHVGIYSGNGKQIHAANSDDDTIESSISQYYKNKVLAVRRFTFGKLEGPKGSYNLSTGSDGPVYDTGFDMEAHGGRQLVDLMTAIGINGPQKKEAAYEAMKSFMGNALMQWAQTNNGGVSKKKNAPYDWFGMAGQGISSSATGINANALASGTITASNASGDLSPGETGGVGRYKMPKGGLYKLLSDVGFKGIHHREAWAVAMKEGNQTNKRFIQGKDDSFGIFQINMLGGLEAERDKKFKQYVPGYTDKNSLLDPVINAKAAAYMSQKGKDWSAWGNPREGRAGGFYEQYGRQFVSASHGLERVPNDGTYNLHAGETVVPASLAQDFREALRESMGGKGSKAPVTINLNINKASDAEAERFARKVMSIMDTDNRMKMMRTA